MSVVVFLCYTTKDDLWEAIKTTMLKIEPVEVQKVK